MLSRIVRGPRGILPSVAQTAKGARFLSTTNPSDPAPAETTNPDASQGSGPASKPQGKAKKLAWFYAVRAGREVGVFKGWDEAKGKVLGFSGATYKPFRSEERARKWLESDISSIDPKDLPVPPKKAEEKDAIYGSRYALSFGSAYGASGDKNGLVGIGWIMRKLPERTLVYAGCDLFDFEAWRKAHPKRPGYDPQLPRELPLLESLNRGLDEARRLFKIEEAIKGKEGEGKEEQQSTKLPYPLHVQCDHVYTVGLLTGANPTLPELVDPLKSARSKVKVISSFHVIEELPMKENTLALGLAKAALARRNPKVTLEGGKLVPTFNSLMRILNNTPDVPNNVRPAQPPSGSLAVNGEELKSLGSAKKQAA
jgi:hypothetical protein